MPIKYNGGSFSFDELKNKIKKEKGLSDDRAAAYTATVERAEKGAKTEDNHPFDSMTPYDKYDLLKKLHNNNSVYVTHINPKYKDLSDVSKKLIDEHMGMTNDFNSAKQHPFNKLAKDRKLELVAKFKGAEYKPYSNDPLYENLDYVAKKGIDNIFNTERINIVSAKLQRIGKDLDFNGSPKTDTKKTGADVKKESEKEDKIDPDEPFNHYAKEEYRTQRLSRAIREAIQSEYKVASYDEDEYKCKDCGKTFRNPDALNEHYAGVHNSRIHQRLISEDFSHTNH
jgi:hypothetical protein